MRGEVVIHAENRLHHQQPHGLEPVSLLRRLLDIVFELLVRHVLHGDGVLQFGGTRVGFSEANSKLTRRDMPEMEGLERPPR